MFLPLVGGIVLFEILMKRQLISLINNLILEGDVGRHEKINMDIKKAMDEYKNQKSHLCDFYDMDYFYAKYAKVKTCKKDDPDDNSSYPERKISPQNYDIGFKIEEAYVPSKYADDECTYHHQPEGVSKDEKVLKYALIG